MADAFEVELVSVLPQLRSIAMSLAGDRTGAEDLLQDSLLRALIGRHSYELGTNLTAWMYRVMRNRLASSHRRRHVPTLSLDAPTAMAAGADGNQEHHMACRELMREVAQLPSGQQATLLLVGAAGCSYDEAARVIGCTVGTVKSRVSRGRSALRARLLTEEPLSQRPERDPPRVTIAPRSPREVAERVAA
jgi:RNA polymerase sigma-70 factor, ECF subfamily